MLGLLFSSFAGGGTVEIEAGGAQHQAGHHVLPHAILTYESELATVQQWSSSETWTLVHSERFTVSLHGLAADAMLAGSDAIILRSQRIDGTSFPTEAELQRGIIDPELTCLIKSALLERCLQAAAGHPGLIQQAVETALRRDTDGRATTVKLGGMFAVEKPRTSNASATPFAEASQAPLLRIGLLTTAHISASAIISPIVGDPSLAQIVAVAARDPARAAKWADMIAATVHVPHESKPHVFPDYMSLLGSPDVDAVYIPLPTSLHYQWIEHAIGYGKHILVEKPFAANSHEVRRLTELATTKGVVLMEGMHPYYHPLRERMRTVVASGAIGAVLSLSVKFTLLFDEETKRSNSRYSRELAGGSTLDIGGYSMSCLCALMGGEVATVKSNPRGHTVALLAHAAFGCKCAVFHTIDGHESGPP